MEYYVIYDNNDNIIAYIDNLEELSSYTNFKKKYLKFHFKNRNYLNYIYDNSYRKIYKFFWEVQTSFFICYTFTRKESVKNGCYWIKGNIRN